MKLDNLFREHNFLKSEKRLIRESNTHNSGNMNQTRIVSELILGEKIGASTEKIINSNQRLADSNEKYSRRMVWLTFALFVTATVDVLVNCLK